MFRALALLFVLVALPIQAWGQSARAVAVTFDDLPFQESEAALCDADGMVHFTQEFVAMLRPLETRGVAFVNEGNVCARHRAEVLPVILNLWLDAGLEMGNHTFGHHSLNTLTAEAWLAEVDRGEAITRPLLATRGQTLRWFRHPFLHTGDTAEKKAATIAGLTARGYVIAPVTIDNNDWMFASAYRQAEAAGDETLKSRIGEAYLVHMSAVLDHWEPYSAEITGGREPAQILLLHANSLNRDWYPRIHQIYLTRGYRFVTLEEALADPVYAHADDYVAPNGVSWLHRWTETDGRTIRWEPEPPKWIRDAYAAID